MARVCKKNINTSFFHIMVQGNNKDEICKEILKQIMVKNNITKEEFCQNEELLSLAIKN